jgi:hypothetical protein
LIAIIAIIAMPLFPILTKAKTKAIKTKGMSNEEQIVLALQTHPNISATNCHR